MVAGGRFQRATTTNHRCNFISAEAERERLIRLDRAASPAVGVPCPSLRLGRWPTGDGPPAHPCWWAGWLAGRVVGRILLGRLRFDPPVGLRRSARHRGRRHLQPPSLRATSPPAEATATATRREESNALNSKALYKQISQALRAFTGMYICASVGRAIGSLLGLETWAREPGARSLRDAL